jgi:SAM-dependent methyltransferase
MRAYIDFAEYYDFDHNISEDIPFYLDYAESYQSPILELACGTGRVLLPIAKAGFEIYGIDISENMLAYCQHTVHQLDLMRQVHLSRADMAYFELPRTDFRLVFAALRSFMHLLTPENQLACLSQVHKHIHPDGCLILNLIAPDPERLGQPPSQAFAQRRSFNLPNGHQVIRKQRLTEHDRRTQVRRFEFHFEEYNPNGKLVRERLVPVFTRYTFRDELHVLLDKAGFCITHEFRDYNRNTYDGTGEMIIVARPS